MANSILRKNHAVLGLTDKLQLQHLLRPVKTAVITSQTNSTLLGFGGILEMFGLCCYFSI